MKVEKDYIYEIENEVSDLNENMLLKPYAYQKMVAKVVEQHLNEYKVNVATTMKSNLAWALASLSFEIVKPVEGCMKMFANTWHSQRKGPYFRREIIFKNENDEVIFKGSTFSILLDIEKRTIYRKKKLPFFPFEPYEEFTIKADPTIKTKLKFVKVDERKVYNSYIDCIGHVNNCRYGEFAYDVFTDGEREDLIKLKRMNIYFSSELRSKDVFSILKAYDGGNIMVRGYNETKECIAFDIVLEF